MYIFYQDISRCLLWIQRHHQTWPQIRTDPLAKPVDLLMLNKLKESYCQIRVSSVDSFSWQLVADFFFSLERQKRIIFLVPELFRILYSDQCENFLAFLDTFSPFNCFILKSHLFRLVCPNFGPLLLKFDQT